VPPNGTPWIEGNAVAVNNATIKKIAIRNKV
jgi:hypothetical protein